MAPFDVKSLFTNINLEYTVDLVLKTIFENRNILSSITIDQAVQGGKGQLLRE